MLTVQDRAIVKATVPLLESGGEALITHFYSMLLTEYPEVRPLFNQAHQASGDQPRALANGVLMYARHIDQLEQVGRAGGADHQQARRAADPAGALPDRRRLPAASDPRSARRRDRDRRGHRRLGRRLRATGRHPDRRREEIYDSEAAAPGGWRGARHFSWWPRSRKATKSPRSTSSRPTAGRFSPSSRASTSACGSCSTAKKCAATIRCRPCRTGPVPHQRQARAGGAVSNHLHDQLHVGDDASSCSRRPAISR